MNIISDVELLAHGLKYAIDEFVIKHQSSFW
jgi:hypothetical protein